MSMDICNYEWSGCTTQNADFADFADIDSLYSDLLRSSEYICLESVQAAFLSVYSGPNKLVDPFPSLVRAFEPGVPKFNS